MIIIATAATAAYTRVGDAQGLESAIMPGQVIRGHAKLESECKNCHVRFDRQAQPKLCLDCHKPVAADVRNRRGYHGRISEHECRVCHTEHKGRNAKIVALDESRFDHALTDFPLRGKHAQSRCGNCHRSNAKHSAAPSECLGCHRKDDKHRGGLGAKCASCHTESGWKDARFDHSRTHFPLTHSHISVKCEACHVDQHYVNTTKSCNSCHRKDDAHKGHFGPRCETCHDSDKWKSPSFSHDRDTHFMLRDRHRAVKCMSCHARPLYQGKIPVNCSSCHRKNDAHKGALGEKCESCHTERAWKTATFNHDKDSRFPLRGKHRTQKCENCHRDAAFREKLSTTCFGCHERDDREKAHKGQLGDQCDRCHNERTWHETTFNHGKAGFPLLGRHASVKCKECHSSMAFKDAKTDCWSCHAKQDRHAQKLGPRCAACHDPRSWKQVNFDHDRHSRFKLLGAHARVSCILCHATPVGDDFVAAMDCAGCHGRKDDVHFGTYGALCENCHVPDGWRKIVRRRQPENAGPATDQAR